MTPDEREKRTPSQERIVNLRKMLAHEREGPRARALRKLIADLEAQETTQ